MKYVRDYFDSEARHYLRERYIRPSCDQFSYEARRRLVLDLLGPGHGLLIDIGSGPGIMTAALQLRGYNVYSMDVSLEMLRQARHMMAAEGPRTRFIEGSLPELPFASESFDAAICVGVLAYVASPAAGLAEIRRVLKPGGVAILQVSNAICPTSRLHSLLRRWYHRAGELFGGKAYPHLTFPLTYFRLGPLRHSLEVASLRVESVASYDFRPPFLQWLIPGPTLAMTRWLQGGFERSSALRYLAEGMILRVRAR